MKLWHCTCEADGQEPYGFYVTESLKEALESYKKDLEWQGVDYHRVSVEAVENVGGYDIRLSKEE